MLMVKVRIRLVSLLRDAIGKPVIELEAGDKPTLGEVIEKLYEMYPKLRRIVEALEKRGLDVVYMVNGRFAGFDEPIGEDDEIVILPPASGG
jgi:MoaD family protein